MQSIQELASLVFACTIAMIISHLLCCLVEKIKNLAVNVMEWKRSRMQRVAEPADEADGRRPVAVEHEWIG